MKHTKNNVNISKRRLIKVGSITIIITMTVLLLCSCSRSGKTHSFQWSAGTTCISTSIDKYIGKGGDVDIPSELPSQVIEISDYAFQNCNDVNSVKIPDTISYIDDYAFQNCTDISSITFTKDRPELYKPFDGSIGNCAFQNCSALKSIRLPSNITKIGDAAFDNCSSLHSVYFDGCAPSLGKNVFTNTASDFTIYYHAGLSGWSKSWYGYKTDTY